ncbi:MAG: ATP-binding protein [Candidatus Cloacimonetes bacterium]|nr:ATP-binding protein [Candidatus Cloacimonadota bacterium]
MLERLYINNYRCLVNFEITFDEMTLLLGVNGTGKTSIFDILHKLRKLIIENVKIGELFSAEDLTVWLDSNIQTIELNVKGNGGEYKYKLEIEHNPEIDKQRINSELLLYDGHPIYSSNMAEVHLFHDDYKKGPVYSFDWSMSGLSTIFERSDNKKLSWFKDWISKLFIVNLQPYNIKSITQEEAQMIDRGGINFASWYKYISQEYQNKVFNLYEHLRKTIPGFDSFQLQTAGKSKILNIGFRKSDKGNLVKYFDFENISDGQKVLVILHTFLISLQNMGYTLLLDEPDNYLALAEIQPWLIELYDLCGEEIPQVILISHHPEMIDYLGIDQSRLIEREPLSPSRVVPFKVNIEEGLKLSEFIARGWES